MYRIIVQFSKELLTQHRHSMSCLDAPELHQYRKHEVNGRNVKGNGDIAFSRSQHFSQMHATIWTNDFMDKFCCEN